MGLHRPLTLLLVFGVAALPATAQEKPVVGLIPKAQRPIAMDGKLTGWDGAFVTSVHVGHPDFANRGGEFLYLWDDQNLYIGLRCLDRTPAHIGTDGQIWNGDAVEFYLDTRRGDHLGAAPFGPGTLHMFYTPFTKSEVKPRFQVRDLPAFKGFKFLCGVPHKNFYADHRIMRIFPSFPAETVRFARSASLLSLLRSA